MVCRSIRFASSSSATGIVSCSVQIKNVKKINKASAAPSVVVRQLQQTSWAALPLQVFAVKFFGVCIFNKHTVMLPCWAVL
ncbi:hypothetical protein Anapl_02241 [Anas platyrhynchos]|uniref:Uncharacterized protein n=1 Tax=Anas platyrhynchos TaxID=8839 RepID=R0LPA5_ANAPL|nr:hypothetical protein Anapl_02241 [Anas platyrhynchos]